MKAARAIELLLPTTSAGRATKIPAASLTTNDLLIEVDDALCGEDLQVLALALFALCRLDMRATLLVRESALPRIFACLEEIGIAFEHRAANREPARHPLGMMVLAPGADVPALGSVVRVAPDGDPSGITAAQLFRMLVAGDRPVVARAKLRPEIAASRSYREVDTAHLTHLIERGFGRRLSPSFFLRAVDAILVAERYAGVAILVDTHLGTYLTKFVVDPDLQGRGIASALWERLVATYPAVFWRARRENPVNAWYASVCDGLARGDEWTVYWRGAFSASQIPALIEHAVRAPVDLIA
ncbi:MAG: GNAT family N-acetyltransferase [Kofleriaceae bacterium]